MNKFFIIVGPGGVGKDTIIKEVIKLNSNLFDLTTCTTRKPRPEDIPGKTLNFFSEKEFKRMIEKGEFLEFDIHFGAYYGSRKKDLEKLLEKGSVVADIDIHGAENLKKIRKEAITIFIKAKSKQVIVNRLKERGMSEKGIKMKLDRFDEEMIYEKKSDYVVINDDLKKAVDEVRSIIKNETK